MAKKQSPDIFQSLRKDAFEALEEASDFESVKKVEADYTGKSGRLTNVLRSLKNLPPPERKTMGSTANALKKEIEEKIRAKKAEFETKDSVRSERRWIDISAPGKKFSKGHLHPLSRVARDVSSIFESMGFEIVEGPEAETEYYNFDALNIPKNHPARDMWNTFWLQSNQQFPISNFQFPNKSQISNSKSQTQKLLLRTHTSPNQMRYMESHQPPFRIIVPGRCFRYEATDATHEVQFYQVEGLMIGEKISLANLKGIMEIFFQKFFSAKGGDKIELRFRPSYFPFVEPGVEVDIKFGGRDDSPHSLGEAGWMEIAGAGMVHPQVIKNAKLNPNEWQGFAFGMGLDRLAMLKYKIDDIRLFYSGDLRFINQF